MYGYLDVEKDDKDDDPTIAGSAAAAAAASKAPGKKGNVLPSWGNVQTMNINPLILTNITGSPYFKINLTELKTYHEVIDEIYYKVSHLEPWERGSRVTAGQTGMCGGVRGVGAGGIVSSAYCLLFKLGTLKPTRKQVISLLNHVDSPYIRGIGFMYLRYSQPPTDLWDWFEDYLDDEEEIDVKAGGGKIMTIGGMVRAFLEKLEWFDTRFPRIPINVQKEFAERLADRYPRGGGRYNRNQFQEEEYFEEDQVEEERPRSKHPSRDRSRSKHASRDRSRERSSKHARSRDRSRERSKRRSKSPERRRSKERRRSRDRSSKKKSRSRERKRSRSREKKQKKRSRSRDRGHRHKHKSHKHGRDDRSPKRSYEDELKKYSEHRDKDRHKHKKHKRSRSRSE